MKITVNKKDNTIEFIPEKDIDSFHLGMVFGHESHSTVIVPPNKIKRVTATVGDIWIMLISESLRK